MGQKTIQGGRLTKNSLVIGAIILFLAVLTAGIVINYVGKNVRPGLYFSEDSDIPLEDRLGRTINVLSGGERYRLVFTIENKASMGRTYSYWMESPMLTKTETVTVKSDEKKDIELFLEPEAADKWELHDVVKDDSKYLYQLTDFTTLGSGGFTTFDVEGFGEILRSDVTLESLEKEPYVKKTSRSKRGAFQRSEIIEETRLYVEDDALVVSTTSTENIHRQKRNILSITLFEGEEEVGKLTYWFLIE